MFKFLFLLFISLFVLTGCSTSPTYKEIEVQPVKVIKETIPGELLTPCKTSPPIGKEEYLALKPHEREQTLTQYIINLYADIKKCDTKITKIRELNAS